MNANFYILFFVRNNRIKNGEVPLYLRITLDGKRAEASVRRKVKLSLWNASAGKANGNTGDAQVLNRYLNKVENDVYKSYQTLLDQNISFGSKQVLNLYLGKQEKHKMLLELFQEHNDQVKSLIGIDFAKGTLERYKTAKMHVEHYINKKYKSKEIPVEAVDHKFITGLEYYLKTDRKCGHNSAIKYITNFKKTIRIAYSHEWIKRDPFVNWKGTLKIVDREFLTNEEIQGMIEIEVNNECLDLVKDIFLFYCYTGLAYADVKKLAQDDLVIGIDGNKWIKINRTKTKTRSSIPILPTAEDILDKYSSHPDLGVKRVLPVLSNQKMNAYLKEIADLCGINKNLTFHLAQHTFATTITLSNGVPIESVSKMLGHKNLQTTQHYAKILDRKVSDDMAALRERMELMKKLNQKSK